MARKLGLLVGAALLAGVVSAALLVRGCERSEAPSSEETPGSARNAPPASPDSGSSAPDPGSFPKPPEASTHEASAIALRERFGSVVERLIRLVDEEGADILIYSDTEEEMKFLREHGTKFRDEILSICRRRSGLFDPLSTRLLSVLPREDAETVRKETSQRLESILGPDTGDPVRRAHLLAQVTRDTTLPIGLRIDALMIFALQKGVTDSATVGEALSLLDQLKEPILRTKLYSLFLYESDARRIVSQKVLRMSIEAVSRDTEPRGTTVEIVNEMGSFLRQQDLVGLRAELGRRVESALISRVRGEADRPACDPVILSGVTAALMNRRSIPSAEEIAQARGLLNSVRAPVRIAAAAVLMPDLESETGHPAVAGFVSQSRAILLETLRREKPGTVTTNILYGLARYRDPATRQALSRLAEDRADLRAEIEDYLRPNSQKK